MSLGSVFEVWDKLHLQTEKNQYIAQLIEAREMEMKLGLHLSVLGLSLVKYAEKIDQWKIWFTSRKHENNHRKPTNLPFLNMKNEKLKEKSLAGQLDKDRCIGV